MQKSHETIEKIETVGGIGPKWPKMIPKRLKGQQLPTINQQLLIHEWSELNEKCLKSLKNLMQKNDMTNLTKLTKLTRKFVKMVNLVMQKNDMRIVRKLRNNRPLAAKNSQNS